MDRIINPFKYRGRITINSSKSFFQRALAISLISESKVQLVGNSNENDILTALKICEKAGLQFKKTNNFIKIEGKITNTKKNISVNSLESGFCARVFSVVLSYLYNDVTINGFGSAKFRSFNFSFLSQLGLNVNAKDLSLPVNIKGEMQSGEICIDGSDGSQLLSGLLITLPFLSGDSVIHVKDLVSSPYVDMTIGVLKDFGIDITNESYKRFYVRGNQKIKSSKYIIEGDWSGAWKNTNGIMKYILTYILILCCVFNLHSDNHIDTIHLNEFIYNESKIIDNQIGVNLQIFNPSLIGQTRSNTFSDFLKLNSSYYIKEYGALATPSFRGTSSSHSIILWNDIPINSFANGIIDFSSIRIDNLI